MATYYFRNVGTDWNTASNWSLTDGGGATGAVPTSADDAYFTSNSGNCTVGTASRVCKTLIFSGVGAGNYSGTFTLNNTLTVSGSITLDSGMTFAGTSTLTVNATSTITSNGNAFSCSFTFTGVTVTLADDMTILGNVTFSTTTVNDNTLTVSGSITVSTGQVVQGTMNLIMNGTGALTAAASSARVSITGNITFNTSGSITINANFFSSGTRSISYVAGDVSVPFGSVFVLAQTGNTTTLDIKGIVIKGTLGFSGQTGGIIDLLSDAIVDGGAVTIGNAIFSGAQAATLNSSGGNLYLGDQSIARSFSPSGSNIGALTGTAKIYTKGAGVLVYSIGIRIQNDIIFNHSGVFRVLDTSLFGAQVNGMTLGGGTYTVISGRFDSVDRFGALNRGNLAIASNSTLIGWNRACGLSNITITNGVVLTMDEFFSGMPKMEMAVFCATTTGNFTVTFQDGSEKIANWIRLTNCTVTNRGQLLILNQKANGGRNVGVRYQNVWPNGVPRFKQNINAQAAGYETAFRDGGLLADPAFSL
jgi:hypothetical protein